MNHLNQIIMDNTDNNQVHNQLSVDNHNHIMRIIDTDICMTEEESQSNAVIIEITIQLTK